MNTFVLICTTLLFNVLLVVSNVTAQLKDGEFLKYGEFYCQDSNGEPFDICTKNQYCNHVENRCSYCGDSYCSIPLNVKECEKRCGQNTSPSTTTPSTTASSTTASSTTASSTTASSSIVPATTQIPSNDQSVSTWLPVLVTLLVIVIIGLASGFVLFYLVRSKKCCFGKACKQIEQRQLNQVHDVNYNPARAVLITDNNDGSSNPTGVPPTQSTDDDKSLHVKLLEDPSVISLHKNGRKLNNFTANRNDQTTVKFVNEQ